jgi:hypothetical protein
MIAATAVLACFLWPAPAAGEAAPPSPTAAPSTGPVSKERALAIARAKLAETKRDADFVIVEARTVERPFGWVFFYEPRKSRAAGAPSAAVPGAGPLVVLKEGGGTAFLSTSVPPDRAIAEYEKTWRRRQERSGPGS